MKNNTPAADNKKKLAFLNAVFFGKRYSELRNIEEKARYLTMNAIFMVALVPLIILGVGNIDASYVRALINFSIAFLCFVSLILLRTKIPLIIIPIFPVLFFGVYHLYLIYIGALNFWAAIGILAFPLLSIFLCQMTIGIIESIFILIAMFLLMFTPVAQSTPEAAVSSRFILAYFFILALTIVYGYINLIKDREETILKAELAQEKDVIQTMKDNIDQGMFLMNQELKILPQYSQPLISILSYYDSDLAGKYFLDILSASLDGKQLQTMKGYFSMMFGKTKSKKVLESVNPISEFEYKAGDHMKTLSTRFNLIEQKDTEPRIIGIIQDITKEKELQMELLTQKEAQELEIKNMFDVIQIDPLVFQDFIEDTEESFNYINATLKDSSLTEKQVVTKFFQIVHAVKSNAFILGLETFGKKLHFLEDEIKKISNQEKIDMEDILSLTMGLEIIMQEKDTYLKTVNRIEKFKTSNQLDSVLVNSLNKAVERIAAETNKKVELKTGLIDLRILETKLRKPIKDILFQCVRNAIYHGIETVDERIRKNKKPQGLLVASVKNANGKIEVNFSDDGRGLDWDRIKAKYLELHPEAKDVDRKALLPAIFSPEFSTSEETTSIAGRGVGLSLVKDLVTENGGGISVSSSESGLSFKFTFPIPVI